MTHSARSNPRLIVEMARANLTWGEERIADELLLKLGIAVSPRTVRCYLSRATLIGTIRVFYKPAAIHEIAATLDRALGRSRSRERSD